jgi:hypothetical protein
MRRADGSPSRRRPSQPVDRRPRADGFTGSHGPEGDSRRQRTGFGIRTTGVQLSWTNSDHRHAANPRADILVPVLTVVASRLRKQAVLLMTVFVAACGAPSVALPVPSAAPTEQVPAVIAPLLSWLQFHTLGCGVSADVGGGVRQWTCVQDAGLAPGTDKTIYRVVARGSTSGFKELSAEVDQSLDRAPSIDAVRGFLADTIGASPVTGSQGAAISSWVVANLAAGGTTLIGGFAVHLDPFGRVTGMDLRPQGSP